MLGSLRHVRSIMGRRTRGCEGVRQSSTTAATTLRPLIIATGNKIKRAIFSRILLPSDLFPFDVQFVDLPGGGGLEVQGSLADVARMKVATAKSTLNEGHRTQRAMILVDDASLEIPALGGMPGPYFKDFCRRIGVVADTCGQPLQATVRSTIQIARSHSELAETFTGSVPGKLLPSIAGAAGPGRSFGDCFQPDRWPAQAQYDQLEDRLQYGCHFSRSTRKFYMLQTLRKAVRRDIMSRRNRFTADGLRSFIDNHVVEVLGQHDAFKIYPTQSWARSTSHATREWLWRNLLLYGVRLPLCGDIKFSILTFEESLQCITPEMLDETGHLELGEMAAED